MDRRAEAVSNGEKKPSIRKLFGRDKSAGCQDALTKHDSNPAVRVAHAKARGPVDAIRVGSGGGHRIVSVEIGMIAGFVPPGAMDSHCAVALSCVVVSVVGGKGLPIVKAQGVPWQGGKGRHIGGGTLPGTLGEVTSQEPQSN